MNFEPQKFFIGLMEFFSILLLAADDDFLRGAARLNNYNGWTQAEREFRLCDWKGLHA